MKRFVIRSYEILCSLRKNLYINYRFHGGLLAAWRCFWGTLISHFPSFPITKNSPDQMDVLTFSVVPSLTLIWLAFIKRIHLSTPLKVYIGDCSGGIKSKAKKSYGGLNIVPYINDAHGQKLDLFIRRYCHAEYILVSDDDVFFLSDAPLVWGLAQMRADPNLAVISFVPRERFAWQINGEEHMPMGSYCLLIRHSIWQRENLSFRTVHEPSPNPNSYRGEYDTADFANVALIRNGYRVLIAPPEIRAGILIRKGLSSTLWEAQSLPVENLPDRFSRPLDVTYANICFVYKMTMLADVVFPGRVANEPVWETLITQVLSLLRKSVDDEIINLIDQKNDDEIKLFATLLR